MKQSITALPKIYIGLDIHKRSWKVNVTTDLFAGKTVSMPPSAEGLKKYIDKHYPAAKEVNIAYEAGCCGYSVHRKFCEYGWQSLVVNPADIFRKGKENYTKTDAIDAQLIARELRDNRLVSITIPDRKRESLRALFRRRNDLVKDYRRIKHSIKMQLLYVGVEIPEEYDNDHWSHAFRDWIEEVEFTYSTLKASLASRMRSFRFFDEELRSVSKELRAYCRKHYKKDYYLLRSIPGIGKIVAAGILSELGDIRRFKNVKQFTGYLGLAPGIHSSGDNHRSQGLSPRCHRLLRSYFVEAAWQAVRVDPVMQAYYRKHLARGKQSKNIVVKVARKLAVRTLAVIKTETAYEIGVVK